METIPNSQLRLEDIPPPDADYPALDEFALTFNGYEELGSFEACAAVANGRRHDTLTNVRACLFFEQRRWRHCGYGPSENDEAEGVPYWRRLVEAIRRFVSEGRLE